MSQINSDLKVFDIIINPDIMGTRKYLIIDGNNIRYTVEDSITMPWDELNAILELNVSYFVKLPGIVKIYSRDIPAKLPHPMRPIDGGAFLNRMEDFCRYMGWNPNDKHFSLNDLIINIEKAPTVDVVPVMRCADCKYFQYNVRQDGSLLHNVDEYECRHWCRSCDPTDFCSYGERGREK